MVKLFTHNDLDGIGCAVLAILAFGDKVDISYCGHGNIDNLVLTHFHENRKDEVHITDICVSESVAKTIDRSCRKYQILDHHKTSLEMSKYRWCKIQIENEDGLMTSGTEMYYKWLIEHGKLQRTLFLDKFVEVVRNYDTWRWAAMGDAGLVSKDINDLFYLYDRDEFIDWAIKEIQDGEFPYFHTEDVALLEANQRSIDEYVDEKERQIVVKTICGVTCGVVFADRYFNDVGHKLCELHPELDALVMIDIGRCSVSCRAEKDGVDVGAIAKHFGGGGHQKASGFEFSFTFREDVIKLLFK